MSIRNARVRDLPEIKKCNERNLPENYNTQTWKTLLSNRVRNSYVLIVADVIVGYIICDGTGIVSFAIDAPFRRRGYGKLLLDKVIDGRGEAGVAPITLHVRIGNAGARALYESRGFTVQSTIPSYYSNPIEDGVLYSFKAP